MPDASRNKKDRKDSQLVLRINGKDRDDFVALCEALDTSAAREIRAFIRSFVEAHAVNAQCAQTAIPTASEASEKSEKSSKTKHSKKKK